MNQNLKNINNKSINVISILLLNLFFVSLVGCELKDEPQFNSKVNKKYIAYYFHPTARCTECLNLESFLKELIETKYMNKEFEFIALNIEEKDNEHFKKDFKLTFSTIVIAKYEMNNEPQWIKLDSIWSYTHNKEEFFRYTENEINNFINQ